MGQNIIVTNMLDSTNSVSQTLSRRNLRISSETASTISGGTLFGLGTQTYGLPRWTASDEVQNDGHGYSDWLVSGRALQWGGSPSHGV